MTTEETRLTQSEAAAVAEIATRHFKAEPITITDPRDGTEVTLVAMPDGNAGLRFHDTSQQLNAARKNPLKRDGRASFTRLDSFIAHVNRFKSGETALFAEDSMRGGENPRITAVIDYHDRVNGEGAPAEPSPRWGQHKSVYTFPVSDEFKTWTEIDGQPMDQTLFAEFLEDHVVDVMAVPDFLKAESQGADDISAADRALLDLMLKIQGRPCGPEKLMELSRGLKVFSQEKVVNSTNLSSGEGQIQFATEHTDADGKPLKVPNMFLIAIPIFRGGAPYRIPVRLRYRKSGPALMWSLVLHNLDLVCDHAVTEACDRAAKETDLPLFYGFPEV